MNLRPFQTIPGTTTEDAAVLAGNLQKWLFQIQNNLTKIEPKGELANIHLTMKDRVARTQDRGMLLCSCAPLGVNVINPNLTECLEQRPDSTGQADAFLIDLDMSIFSEDQRVAENFILAAVDISGDPQLIKPRAGRLTIITLPKAGSLPEVERFTAILANNRIPLLVIIDGGPSILHLSNGMKPFSVTGLCPTTTALTLLVIGELTAESIRITRDINPNAADECTNALMNAFSKTN